MLNLQTSGGNNKDFEELLQALDRSPALKSRLLILRRLIDEGRSDKATVLNELFPGKPPKQASGDFRLFKSRVNKKAIKYGIPLVIAEDEGKVLLLPSNKVHLTPKEEDDIAVGSMAGAMLEYEPVNMAGKAFVTDRPLVEIFVSYAHKDKKLVKNLLESLEASLKNKLRALAHDKDVELRFSGFWRDEERLLPGDNFREEIEIAIKRSVLGLFMVSPHALASDYIENAELPLLRESGKLVPIGLKQIDFADLKPLGISKSHVFRLENKFYNQIRGHNRERFAEELAEKLKRKIEHYLAGGMNAWSERGEEHTALASLERVQQDWLRDNIEPNFVNPPAEAGSLEATLDTSKAPLNSGGQEKEGPETPDALARLKAWALGESKEPLAVVLGEYGMGKTTLTRWLTNKLLEERNKGRQNVPLPIYFDLRNLSPKVKKNPNLETILQALIDNWYKSGEKRSQITPQQVVSLVRSGRAFVIFDGLDEVLVYLTPEEGRHFVRELWSITYDRGKRVGRAVMATRTHYFRTLQGAVSYFTGEDREDISGKDYLALLLLPFNEEQIRTYFERGFGDKAQAERAMELVETVYNLSELAKRPYLLRLIRENYGDLERLKAEGLRVSAARFYDLVVESWIQRDNPKHQIKPDHKRLFMEHLAAELWKSGERSWHVDQVETWFINFLRQNQELEARYSNITPEFMDRLIEDLRTATFIVHDGEDRFRFAHTSLQEFFLASYFLKAIEEKHYERWSLPTPSPETFDFLAQLWRDGEKREKLFKNARAMGQKGLGKANENLVRFMLFARERYDEFKNFIFARFNLAGASLLGLELGNPSHEGPKVNWVRAVFDGAKLRDTRFTNANLEGASFKETDLTRAEFWKSRMVEVTFEKATLTGTFFREVDLREAHFEKGEFYRTKWIRSRLKNVNGLPSGSPAGFFAKNDGAKLETPPEQLRSLALPRRLCGSINALVPLAGDRLAAGDWKGNLWVLDAETGERSWEVNMPGSVRALASLSGDRLAAGSGRNLWILDAETGERSWEVNMPGSVRALASLSGDRLAAGDQKGNLWILDSETGERSLDLEMPASVLALATLPGDRLAAGDWKGNLWVLDAETGERSWEVKMPGSVRALASLSGDRLAAGDWKGNLWVLDAETGERSWEVKMPGSVRALASLSGDRLAAGDWKGNLWVLDAETGERSWEVKMPGSVRALASLSGDRLAAGGEHNLWILDSETGERSWKLWMPGRIYAISFFPSDQLAAGGDWGNLWVLDAETGERSWEVKMPRSVRALASLPGGWLAAGDDWGNLWVLDAETGERSWEVKMPRSVRALASLPGGWLAAGSGHNLWILDAGTGERSWEIEMPESILTLTTLPGSRLATGDQKGNLWVLDAETGEQGWKLEMPGSVWTLASLPGDRLAAGDRKGNLWILDSETGERSWEVKMPRSVWALASLPGGWLAAGDDWGNLWVLDAETGERSWEVKMPRSVRALASLPSNRLAATGGWGNIWVLNIKTGEKLAEFVRAPDGEYLSAFGNKIVTASPRAWRWAYVRGREPETGRLEVYPYEAVGEWPE